MPCEATQRTKRGCGWGKSPSRRHLVISLKSTEFMLAGFHLSNAGHVYGRYGSRAGVKMMPSLPWLSFLKGSSKA